MSAHVRVVERHGTVAELHAADLFADLHPSGDVTDVVICQPTGAAIALGSRQRTDIVDLAETGDEFRTAALRDAQPWIV